MIFNSNDSTVVLFILQPLFLHLYSDEPILTVIITESAFNETFFHYRLQFFLNEFSRFLLMWDVVCSLLDWRYYCNHATV